MKIDPKNKISLYSYPKVLYSLYVSHLQKLFLHIRSLCPTQIKSWNIISKHIYGAYLWRMNFWKHFLLGMAPILCEGSGLIWQCLFGDILEFSCVLFLSVYKVIALLTAKDEQLSQPTAP